MSIERIHFVKTHRKTARDWETAVALHLAGLPAHGWTPAQDLAMVEHYSGQDPRKLAHVEGYLGTGHLARVHALFSIIREEDGTPSLDGRKALLDALRARVPQ